MPWASCDGAAAGSMTTSYVTYVHADARGERRARHFSMAMCLRLCLCVCTYGPETESKHWQARQGEASSPGRQAVVSCALLLGLCRGGVAQRNRQPVDQVGGEN